MWAQLMKMRLKPGNEGELERIVEQLRAIEQPNSGLVRSTTMRDQNDPDSVYFLAVFESEEKARERENDSRRQAALEPARAKMAQVFEGPPEFIDLNVVGETVGSQPRAS